MTEPHVMDWPFVESDMYAWRSWAGKGAKMLDSDTLLRPLTTTKDQITGWQDVVRANTAALKEIRLDLANCNNQEKVQAIINKVEIALQDLSADSQKIPGWMREDKGGSVQNPNMHTVGYGQYPINQPMNPANPVPWPPGYTPPAPQGAASEQEAKTQAKAKA